MERLFEKEVRTGADALRAANVYFHHCTFETWLLIIRCPSQKKSLLPASDKGHHAHACLVRNDCPTGGGESAQEPLGQRVLEDHTPPSPNSGRSMQINADQCRSMQIMVLLDYWILFHLISFSYQPFGPAPGLLPQALKRLCWQLAASGSNSTWGLVPSPPEKWEGSKESWMVVSICFNDVLFNSMFIQRMMIPNGSRVWCPSLPCWEIDVRPFTNCAGL